jgi:type II secretory pathway pseudopilin PulG
VGNLKKKKGSSLITVILIFAILLTVGTSVLTMSVSDYKSRIVESKRIENLYGADSGIDTAYNITGSVVKTIVDKSNSYAESTNIDNINSAVSDNKPVYFNDDGTVKKEAVAAILNPSFKEKYRELIKRDLLYCIKHRETIANIEATTEASRYSEPIGVYTTNSPQFDDTTLEGLDANNLVTSSNEVRFKLTIKSKYQDASSSNGVRTVSAVYYIDVPDYTGNYGVKTSSATGYVPIFAAIESAIAADGDLTIDSVGGANIYGPVYIKGNESSGSGSIAYSKYSGGISVKNVGGNVGFNGDVVTSRTFRVIDNAQNVNISSGTLYANNIYVGKDEGGYSNNAKLQAQDVIIDNDLAMNASNSSITINNGLYAISDINRTGYAKKDAKEKSSSSIIMNSNDSTSRILVNGKAYIMGTAYINTNEPYQTGESVALKGNYNAYATIIPQDGSGYFYKYYSPLTLIDKKDITVVDKAAHFYNYATNNQYKGTLNITNQIQLPTNNNSTISTGAYISNGVVYPANYTANASFQNDLSAKRRLFSQQVYEMGDVALSDTSTLDNDYNNGTVKKTVANQLNLAQDKNKDYIDISKDGSNNCIIINTNPKRRIFIKGHQASFNETISSDGDNGDIVVDKDASQALNAVIISAGDVYISGNITYKGTLITEGNVKIEGRSNGENIEIRQDSKVQQNIFSKYYDNVSKIFDMNALGLKVTNMKVVPSTSVKSSINIDNIIHKGQWSINKK